MKTNFIDDLIRCVARVVPPNMALLKEVLVIGGMPEKTQNLQYLSYNRHCSVEKGQNCEFSAVAVINNRRAVQWQLDGYAKKISRWIFSTRWTRNPLDLFLNNLRCDRDVMRVLERSGSNYSLLGILTRTDLQGSGLTRRHAQYISPVVAIPGLAGRELKIIQDFEAANRIRKMGPIGLGFYRKTGRQMAGV
jgi:hypothetical protein